MKAVFFDLDGTLFDTLEDIAFSVNYALRAYDIDPVPLSQVRHYVGRGLRNALAQAVAASGRRVEEEDFDLMHQLLMGCYERHPADHTVPYEGVEDLLSSLKGRGIKTGLLSNKADTIVQGILRKYPLAFDYASGAVPGVPLKPAPDLFLKALSGLGVSVEETVYVGDSEVDAEFARRAGCRFLIVSYGFRTKEELSGSGIAGTLCSVGELRAALLG